ncbi:hypothetical protein CRUP_017609 [Coryphaenoides rupestris]|nr:hypothetical protein CRUP_017609 [Coryphaenoides rupestris]
MMTMMVMMMMMMMMMMVMPQRDSIGGGRGGGVGGGGGGGGGDETPVILQYLLGDRCNRFSLTSFGALYISDVQKEDALSTYRCITRHKTAGPCPQTPAGPAASTGLTISGLRSDDSGSYACEVTNSFGSKEVSGQLHIIDPLHVTLSPKSLKTGISSTLFFTCTVEGTPEYAVTWYRNTEPVLSDQHISIQGSHNDTLQITAAQKFHSGAYQCFAARKGITTQDFSIILLEDGTPRIVSSFSERVVNTGEPFSLMCGAKGAPPPSITWTLDDEPVVRDSAYKTSQYTLSDGLTVSHVNVSNPLIRDGGVLIKLYGGGAPRIRPMRDITAVAGRNTYITCRVIGYPYYSIKWLKEGMQLPDNHRQVVFENGTLRLTDVQKGADEGTYLCSVLILPQLSINQTVHVTVKERGDSVFFSCHAINSYGEGRGLIQLTVQDPPELEVREVKDRSMNLRWIQRFDGNSIITSYDIEYKNNIRMYSYNKIGRSAPSKELTISTEEAQPDGPPMDVILQPMTSQSIRVTWRAPKKELQNGLIRGYQIGYRENGPGSSGQYSIVEMKATGDSEVYTLDNLKKFAQSEPSFTTHSFRNKHRIKPEPGLISLSVRVPSEPPQNVRAISVTSDEAVITWAEPPRVTLHGVLKGYRVVYWSLFPDGEWGEMQNITTMREQVEMHGLEKFTNYSVQVLAYTQAGDGGVLGSLKAGGGESMWAGGRGEGGGWGGPTASHRREVVPGPPAGIKAVPSSPSSVVVSWLPPHKPNGVIRKYTIYCSSPASGHPAPSEYEANPEMLSYRITHLSRGMQYHIWAAAVTTAGRGNMSDKVVVEPAGKVPAKILSFGGTVTTPWMKEVRLPCGSVGEPAPTVKWTKDSEDSAAPVAVDSQRLVQSNGTLVLRSVKAEDSGYYTCTATNTLGFDTIIVNLVVQVPPDQPRLTVSTTSTSSITLAWIPGDNGGSSIRGFVLQYSVDNTEEWRDVFISSTERSFRLENLRCGTWYKPVFTKDQPLLTHINSTHAGLNLMGWTSGGCPITGLLLDFRPKGTWAWQTVRANATGPLFLSELREATWYELKMKACNSAGCGNQSSQFATTDYDGSTIPPIKSARGDGDNVKKLFSIGSPVILVSMGVALLFIIRRKRKEKRLKRLRGEEEEEQEEEQEEEEEEEYYYHSKNNRSIDTPVKGPPQGPRLHIDIPRVQLLIEDKEGIKQIGEDKAAVQVTDTEFSQSVNPQNFCTGVSLHHQALIQNSGPLIDMSDIRPGTNPVSRKSIKSAHSSRNRYSSQWTLSRPGQSQSTASARTLTSDWRTMGSHGITATESDSYSASLSQDTDKGRNSMVSTESASSTYEELARAYEHAKLEEHLQHAKFTITECFISDSSSDQMTTGTNDPADSMTSLSTPSEPGICRFTASPPKPQDYDRGKNVAVPIPHRANKSEFCNLPLYMKSDPFFRKQSELHDPCPVVPPREASIRSLAQRAYHTQGRHLTLDPAKQALTLGHSGLSSLGLGSGTATLPQRTLTATAATASTSSTGSNPTPSSKGGSRDSLLESSSSALGRLQKQSGGAGAYSKSYTLV